MTNTEAVAAIKSAATEMLIAGRYQANNGATKREHGRKLEVSARAKMAEALAVLSAETVR